jgi:hypothetical protein
MGGWHPGQTIAVRKYSRQLSGNDSCAAVEADVILGWPRSLWARTLLRIVAVIAILAAFVALAGVRDLLASFDRRLLWAALALQPFFLSVFGCLTWRHAILVRQPPTPFGVTFVAVILAIGLNIVIPGRMSELVKPTYLRQHAGIPISNGLAAIVVERLGDAVVFGSIAIAVLAMNVAQFDWRLPVFVAIAGLATLFAIPWLERLVLAIANRLPFETLRTFVGGFFAHAVLQIRSGTVIKAMLLTAVAWSCNLSGVVMFLTLQPFEPLTLAQMAAVFAAVTFASSIPGLPGGFGAYEAAAVLVLTHFGYSINDAFVVGLTMHLSQLAIPALLTPIFIATRQIGLGELARDFAAEFKRPPDAERPRT